MDRTHVHTRARMHACHTSEHTYTYIHTQTHADTHTHTHTHIHIQTHATYIDMADTVMLTNHDI